MPNMFGKVKPTNSWTNLNTASTKKLWLQEFKKYKQVRVTLKSSSEQRVRFYSLERSSPLLDIGHKT